MPITITSIKENGIPDEALENLIDKVGCSLVGGLYLVGFYLPAHDLSGEDGAFVNAKIKEKADFLKLSKEFANSQIILFFTNNKNYKICSFRYESKEEFTFPSIKFKEITDMISSAHLFLNKPYYLRESEEAEDEPVDNSMHFDVTLQDRAIPRRSQIGHHESPLLPQR